jgi:twitching motility two-component system response regulator PilG
MRLSSLKIITLICLFTSLASCSEEVPPVGKMPPIMKLGEKAPDFAFQSLLDPSNIEQKLSQYQGKVIYLDFWASWCKPCLKSMPLLNELRTELAKEGFEVITATDGFEALSMIADHQPNLILLDVMMPRLDGYQTCALIKHHRVFRHTPVVMLSSKDGLFDRARGRVVGSDNYITKPFTREELLTVIEQHTDNAD